MQIKTLALLGVFALLGGPLAAQPPWGGGPGGGFDPSGFISRLDVNGNGQIDPEEAEGRAGYFLRRIAEDNSDIDLSKPVPLDRIEKAFAAARERREAERGREDGDRDNGGRSRDEGSSSSRSSSAGDELLVPGFGEEADLPSVPGFGLMASAVGMIQVTQADRDEAARRFRYYDRNNDGVLDEEEMERVRSRDYQDYDSNHDGKLTLEELAVRYAKRRVEEEEEDRRDSSSSRYATAQRQDDNSDQRRDGDRRGGWYGRRDEDSRDSRNRGSSESGSDLPIRLTTDSERLEKIGAPSWFRESDKNGDGQVAMAEYSDNWTDDKLAEFAGYDLNGDGMITPQECFKAAKAGVSRSSSSSSRSIASRSRGGFSRTTPTPPPRTVAQPERNDERRDEDSGDEASQSSDAQDNEKQDSDTASDASESAEDKAEEVAVVESASTEPKAVAPTEVDPQYLSYAQGRIKQLDANEDGLLQSNEWAKMRKPPDGADTNNDELITAQELAIFIMQQ